MNSVSSALRQSLYCRAHSQSCGGPGAEVMRSRQRRWVMPNEWAGWQVRLLGRSPRMRWRLVLCAIGVRPPPVELDRGGSGYDLGLGGGRGGAPVGRGGGGGAVPELGSGGWARGDEGPLEDSGAGCAVRAVHEELGGIVYVRVGARNVATLERNVGRGWGGADVETDVTDPVARDQVADED